MKRTIQHFTVVSLLLICSHYAFPQNPWIDSLRSVLLTLPPDTSKVFILVQLSGAYQLSRPDSGVFFGEQAYQLARELRSDSWQFWSLAATNSSLYILGDYTLALANAVEAIPLGQKLNTPYTLGFSNGMLSDCYYNVGDYNTSMDYWRRVVRITKENSLHDAYAVYGNSARIFRALKQYDSALYCIKMTMAMVSRDRSIESYTVSRVKGIAFCEFGNVYSGLGHPGQALEYYRKSLPHTRRAGIDAITVDAFSGIAAVYYTMGDLDSAIWYAKAVLNENITNYYPSGRLKSTDLLAAAYEAKHNADSSLKYLHLSIAIKDSLFTKQKIVAFQNILFKESEKQRAVEDAKLTTERRYFTYFIVAFFILTLIAAGAIARHRRARQLQAIRNSIADDLHDDIGSTLSSISIMNELAKTKSPEAISLLTAIGESTTAMQENMSDIVWAIKAGNDRFENVLTRMNQFATGILESKNIALDFSTDSSLYPVKLKMTQRKSLYLFFKEAINNAAKHSGAQLVVVQISKHNDNIELNISDNGSGFDTSKVLAGNGMSSLRKRVTELRAKFKLTSILAGGTTVQLRFPISQARDLRKTTLFS